MEKNPCALILLMIWGRGRISFASLLWTGICGGAGAGGGDGVNGDVECDAPTSPFTSHDGLFPLALPLIDVVL